MFSPDWYRNNPTYAQQASIEQSIRICHDKAAIRTLDAYRKHKLRLTTVESCTGGGIIAALCAQNGASDIIEAGLITYSNNAKVNILGVHENIIQRFGAVSAQTAIAMAEAGRQQTGVDVALAVTGIAGPSGGSSEKPVGLVHFAVARDRHHTYHHEAQFTAPPILTGKQQRNFIQDCSIITGLELLLKCIES